jgi:hypothetical protein
MKAVNFLQVFSFVIFVLCVLVLLGAEPETFSEKSLYEYQHFMDRGHLGWIVLRLGGLALLTLIITAITLNKLKAE